MKLVLLWFLKIYQRFFTVFSFGSCRYYPTCSEYAKWQIRHNNLLYALFFIIFRILRCNQLFKGGIDYPKISKNMLNRSIACSFKKKRVIVWFVPANEKEFFVIRSLDSVKNNLTI